MTAETPGMQALDVFEVYERDGALLVVTSDLSGVQLRRGDRVVRRRWSTCALPEFIKEQR